MKYATVGTVLRRGLAVAVLTVTMLAPARGDLGAAQAGRPATSAVAAHAVFTFGLAGNKLHPLRITIWGTGRVSATSGVPARTWSPRNLLSKDAIDGLVKLAQAEGMVALAAQSAQGPAPVSGRFITIDAGSLSTSVFVGHARNVAFDQLYAVLLAAADVVGEAPPGGLSPE